MEPIEKDSSALFDLYQSTLRNFELFREHTGRRLHDANNQLSGIIGIITLLERGDRFTADHNQIREIAFALHELLKEIGTYDPTTSGPRITDLQTAAQYSCDHLEPLITPSIRLSNLITEPLNVHADPEELTTLLTNLGYNSIQAIKNRKEFYYGQIQYNAEFCDPLFQNKYSVHMTVSDNGVGMSAKQCEQLLNKPIIKGNRGLGSVHAKNFMIRCNGKMTIDSVLGEGTTVHIYFPPTPDYNTP